MELAVKVKSECFLRMVQLVAAASKALDETVVEVDPELGTACKVENDASITTMGKCFERMAATSPLSEQLLGTELADSKKQVDEYVSKFADLPVLGTSDVAQLNGHLEGRTFIVGQRLTLADLVVYAAISKALTTLPPEDRPMYISALRWYDHLNHVVDVVGLYPNLELARPAFVAPAPAPKVAAAAESKKEAPAAKEAAKTPSGQAPAAKPEAKKKERKKERPAAPAVAAAPSNDEPTVDYLDLRVGQIVSVEQHPNAESLYLETIDLGEDAPRQVVSGLVKFVPLDQMTNRMVVVVTNLKPAKMRDIMSYGMVLCASNDAHDAVDPVLVPEGVPVGEKITFEGFTREPEAQLNPRKKQFEKIAPHLIVGQDGICAYKGVPFMTSRGPITATIPGAHIA